MMMSQLRNKGRGGQDPNKTTAKKVWTASYIYFFPGLTYLASSNDAELVFRSMYCT
jgi:hypothetical protein